MGSNNRGEEELKQMAELSSTLKEGERILAPTRRPDGTLRKAIRIRAGYFPQDEVAIYQSKGALWKKEMASQLPPGYDADSAPKPKTKATKRNERKKEKKLLTAAENSKSPEEGAAGDMNGEAAPRSEPVNLLTSEMEDLAVSSNTDVPSPTSNPSEVSDPGNAGQDIDKRIRALKKKIRLTEAQQQKTAPEDLKPEQLEKFSKSEDWRQELKALEDKKAELMAAST